MYVDVIASHAEVHQEGDDRNWFAHVDAFLSDHHPRIGRLLGYLVEQLGIALCRPIVLMVFSDIQGVLESKFCCFQLLQLSVQTAFACIVLASPA